LAIIAHTVKKTWQCVFNVYNKIMKRRDLIKRLEKAGFVFVRHGGRHDVYKRGEDEEQIPRHNEINEMLAKAIIRKWGL
jgi:mRNA interferase HicA